MRLGALAAIRVLMATEEHGAGRQLLRFRIRPRVSPVWLVLVALGISGGVGAAASHAWPAALVLGIAAGLVATRALSDSGRAIDAVRSALDTAVAETLEQEQPEPWQEAIERVA